MYWSYLLTNEWFGTRFLVLSDGLQLKDGNQRQKVSYGSTLSWTFSKTNLQSDVVNFLKNKLKSPMDKTSPGCFVTTDLTKQIYKKKKWTSDWSYSKSLHSQSKSYFYSIIRWSYWNDSVISFIPHSNWGNIICFQSIFWINEQDIYVELSEVNNAHILKEYFYIRDFKLDGNKWPGELIREDLSG